MKKKVKILYIDEAIDFGGSLIVLASMVNYCTNNIEPFVNIEIDDFSELDDSIKISKIKHNVTYADLIRLKNSFFEKIQFKFFQRLISFFLDAYRLLGNIPYMYGLYRLIKNNKIDIVHLNNALGNGEANLVCLLTGVKTLVHFHGGQEPGRIAKMLIKSRATFYLSISEFIADRVKMLGLAGKDIKVLHNPYFERASDVSSQELSELRLRHNIGENTFVVGIVGRIVDWKGQLETVKAFNLVRKKIPNVKLLIIGGPSDGVDDYYEKLLIEIKQLELDENVVITGYQKEVDHYYQLIDVCIHASTLPEPFGLVIIEGMAKAKPVIAANTGATKEIINEGINGYLVDVFDERAFSKKIIKLLESEPLRVSLGNKGKEKVENEFNIKNYTRELESIYTKILS